MKSLIQFCLVGSACAVFMFANSSVDAQFEDSSKWVPQSANVIAMVRNKKILNSEIGVKEKWRSNRSKAFRAGTALVHPDVTRAMIATQMDLQFMQPLYNIGVFQKGGDDINMTDISKRVGGDIEMIGELNAIVLPNDTYLVEVDKSTVVTMSPSNRQMFSRIMARAISGSQRISPYLAQAVKFADDNADVILAIDLEGILGKAEIKKRLQELPGIDPTFAVMHTDAMASIKGVTLGITVNDKITGSVKFDFAESPAGMLISGKDVFLAILKKNGVMIDDFESWNMTASENQLRLTGRLSSGGLRQIGSLIAQPIHEDFTYAGSEGGVADSNMATKSKQYFSDVDHEIEILRNRDLKNLKSYQKWFERGSLHIDRMSTLGVDKTVVDYGTYVSNAFRDVTGSLRSSDYSRASAQSSQLYRSGVSVSGGGYGPWGRYGNYDADINSSRNMSRNARMASNLGTMKGKNDASAIAREIEAETAKVRRDMSQKYKINF